MKIAFVYDWVDKYGGAERILTSLHSIWPDAPLFTSVYNKDKAPWAKDFQIIPSFLQKIPFLRSHHEVTPTILPYAFESFHFDEYDTVISLTSFAAKGIITKPKTLHVCYCLTPTRFLWSGKDEYHNILSFNVLNNLIKNIFPVATKSLRTWDYIAAQRPDIYATISKTTQKRIEKYYKRDSTVIYPGIRIPKNFQSDGKKGEYFLIVSRLVPYKRIDIAIEAANKLKVPLKIIGAGSNRNRLQKIAGKTIEFIDRYLTETELVGYYQNCIALLFPGEEDFGLVSLEAQSLGKPVIAYEKGGLFETVKPGITGEFFYPQTKEALINVLEKFKPEKYSKENCFNNALLFTEQKFVENFKSFVEEAWKKHQYQI